ncbi:phage head closure protein [Sphingomonas colocasiae]|uniref:Phage head closure protein n=1 Tax=Sphingomonas colocasiae TaxID=1848973 RepID=A0ABS7PXN8_9SPHN|nr:phage head closure protein [Sphingomonas colocasiae]MBY8826117.1 phage head closure protein [Sphingomonas colocasiae]
MRPFSIGKLDRQIQFQRKAVIRDPRLGAITAGGWVPHGGKRWANVQEVLPSKAEQLEDAINMELRPVRIRMRYRTDITGDMRILYRGRTLEIVSGPVELGRRQGIELMAQEYSSAGDPVS